MRGVEKRPELRQWGSREWQRVHNGAIRVCPNHAFTDVVVSKRRGRREVVQERQNPIWRDLHDWPAEGRRAAQHSAVEREEHKAMRHAIVGDECVMMHT